jgi:4-aminobutyrate aminotransferase-like enzyme
MAAGHGHHQITEAIATQATRLVNCYASTHPLRSQLADALLEIAGPPFDRTIFVTTGSEAIDASLKIARHVTGRSGVITFSGAFHGRTLGGVSVAGTGSTRKGIGSPVSDIVRAPFPYPYRWEFGEPVAETALALTQWAAETAGVDQIGAILVEPFLGAGGVLPAPRSFMLGLRELAERIGALLIFDEIQSGLGRCGEWFSYLGFGITPDLVVGSKALGGGLPITAVMGRSEVLDTLPAGSMTSTFGGNPLACAAGLATLKVLKDENLVLNASEVSRVMLQEMESWVGGVDAVGDVRGVGLSFGVELVHDLHSKTPAPELATAVASGVWEEGLVILPPAGAYGNVVRFAPPLSMSAEEALEGLGRLRRTLERVASTPEERTPAYAER